MLDTQHRESVLDKAMAAGKFPQARRAHYAALFDRDPDGIERLLDVMEGIPPQLLAFASGEQQTVTDWTRQLFPETRPQQIVLDGEPVGVGYTAPPEARAQPSTPAHVQQPTAAHVRPTPPPERATSEPPAAPAAAGTFGAGDVDAWSRELFPDALRPGDPIPLIVDCND
jgi:hypothetical protein